MSSVADTRNGTALRESPALTAGAAVIYLGFALIAVSVVWTVESPPQATVGLFERHVTLLLGLVLVVAALAGGRRLAGNTAGKLLCAVGAAVAVSQSLRPTLESLPALGARLPMWALDAYPGLATIGWIVAALGALVWWAGGPQDEQGSLYRRATVVCALLLLLVTWGLRLALVAAGYDVPPYGSGLIAWRLVEAGVVLLVALSVSGQRRFGQWPMLLFGLALVTHAVRQLLTPPA